MGQAFKCFVAVGLLLAAFISNKLSQQAYLRIRSPELTYNAHPDDAVAAAAVFVARIAKGGDQAKAEIKLSNLKTALRFRPLTAELLTAQALLLERKGKRKFALSTMRLADRATRRGAVHTLWLLESSSASGDVSSAIRHYNAALAVHPELYETLLPILSAALIHPDVVQALKPYLAAQAYWSDAFLDVVSKEASPTVIEALLLPLPRALLAQKYRPQLTAILHRLAVESSADIAIDFARASIPGFVPQVLSELAPTVATRDQRLGRFAWNFTVNNGIAVTMNEDQAVQIIVQPLARGPAAVRDIMLQNGGTYVLTQRVRSETDAIKPRLRWLVFCVAKSGLRPLWDHNLEESHWSSTTQAVLEIPQDCPVVRFSLVVDGLDAQMPASAFVDQLSLSKQ